MNKATPWIILVIVAAFVGFALAMVQPEFNTDNVQTVFLVGVWVFSFCLLRCVIALRELGRKPVFIMCNTGAIPQEQPTRVNKLIKPPVLHLAGQWDGKYGQSCIICGLQLDRRKQEDLKAAQLGPYPVVPFTEGTQVLVHDLLLVDLIHVADWREDYPGLKWCNEKEVKQ